MTMVPNHTVSTRHPRRLGVVQRRYRTCTPTAWRCPSEAHSRSLYPVRANLHSQDKEVNWLYGQSI